MDKLSKYAMSRHATRIALSFVSCITKPSIGVQENSRVLAFKVVGSNPPRGNPMIVHSCTNTGPQFDQSIYAEVKKTSKSRKFLCTNMAF